MQVETDTFSPRKKTADMAYTQRHKTDVLIKTKSSVICIHNLTDIDMTVTISFKLMFEVLAFRFICPKFLQLMLF